MTADIPNNFDEENERFLVEMDTDTHRYLRNIQHIGETLKKSLSKRTPSPPHRIRYSKALGELSRIIQTAVVLALHDKNIYWLEKRQHSLSLHSVPKSMQDTLFESLWDGQIPIVLTSGTLSTNGDFSHIKRSLGMDKLPVSHLMEARKLSPFNYKENLLIYISESVPFPNIADEKYITAVAKESEQLLWASFGHAALLFTSYRAMDKVYKLLKARNLPFPMFRLERGDNAAIERFRVSGNGILFASGAMWEGIDLPGDILSLLIIVKLPFPVPDPINEYEKAKHSSIYEYKRQIILPETAIRAVQGAGRVLRSEKDTGCVVFFDSRMRPGSPYREVFLRALPECTVTNNIHDVRDFMLAKKDDAYSQVGNMSKRRI